MGCSFQHKRIKLLLLSIYLFSLIPFASFSTSTGIYIGKYLSSSNPKDLGLVTKVELVVKASSEILIIFEFLYSHIFRSSTLKDLELVGKVSSKTLIIFVFLYSQIFIILYPERSGIG